MEVLCCPNLPRRQYEKKNRVKWNDDGNENLPKKCKGSTYILSRKWPQRMPSKKALRSKTVIKDCHQTLPKVLVVFGCRDCTCGFDNPLVTSCVSDAQNCGKSEILRVRVATLLSFRACRMLKTVVKWTFGPSPTDPFVSVCVADVENWCFCGGAVVFCCFFCGGVVFMFLSVYVCVCVIVASCVCCVMLGCWWCGVTEKL